MLLKGDGGSKKVENSFKLVHTIHIIVSLIFLINLRYGVYGQDGRGEGSRPVGVSSFQPPEQRWSYPLLIFCLNTFKT